MSADLRPQDPIEIKITTKDILIGTFVFALVFWIIGLAFRYYVYVGGAV